MRRACALVLPGFLVVVAVFSGFARSLAGPGDLGQADFRYAPPWWQSAICLPDDPDKALVGKEGQVLLDFGKGKVRNFRIVLQPEAGPGCTWVEQRTLCPRVPIVQTRKTSAGLELLEEAFVVVPDGARGGKGAEPTDRRIIVLVTVRNPTQTPATAALGLRIDSIETVKADEERAGVVLGARTLVRSSEPAGAVLSAAGADGSWSLKLPRIDVGPGESRRLAWTIDRASNPPSQPFSVEQACTARDEAVAWWARADLPYATIQVPDPGIQGMLDSCVRNIWQAREIKRGLPAFHVGPTVYRSLWVVDGAFLLESAAILGRGRDARAGVEYLLSHQKPDGSFEILRHYWKENGIVLWAATRHALLTQDPAWLRAQWPKLQAVVRAIQSLRARALADPAAPEYGLLPPGEIDGGINNATKPEYSNTYWCLAGLRAAVDAARWLGKEDDASAWQHEYDDLFAAYRKAAARDTRRDALGNAYVPTLMGDLDHHVPQRGQWAFCHAVYPGGLFAPGDPLAEGQLAMLRATRKDGQGLIYDTGWMKQGIWTYFASFYGHAALWTGHGREAAEVLYDFARHASPVRTWREEQKPVGHGNQEVGDMPHNWASAEFVRLTAHLIELDRDRELHLLEGFPREWAGPGMVTRLDGVLTPFGPLRLELSVSPDRTTAHLKVARLSSRPPTRIVLHLEGLTGNAETRELPVDRDIDQTIVLSP